MKPLPLCNEDAYENGGKSASDRIQATAALPSTQAVFISRGIPPTVQKQNPSRPGNLNSLCSQTYSYTHKWIRNNICVFIVIYLKLCILLSILH
jgi:hypothetical protein